jgi:hypothetical protein
MSLYLISMRRQWDHNFEGVFSPNSIYEKTELREIIGEVLWNYFRCNRGTMLQVCSIWLLKMCIGSIVPELNIFKVFRIDFAWRGNYLNTPDTQRFPCKRIFWFYFRTISSCTLYLYSKPCIKGCRSHLLKKTKHERSWSPNGSRSNFNSILKNTECHNSRTSTRIET